jgi:predicted ATP-grasp superfamily ATP-dependent carboligase
MSNWPTVETRVADFVDWISQPEIPDAVLMPCSDPWVRTIAASREQLPGRFKVWTTDVSVIDKLVNKNTFLRSLIEAGIPHPRTFNISDIGDFDAVPDDFFSSAFLKPFDSPSYLAHYGRKGIAVQDRSQAIQEWQRARNDGHPTLLQEYVPGGANRHVFIDGYRSADGSRIEFLARRRLRMFPPDFGNSTAMISIPLAEAQDCLSQLKRLFSNIEYTGIFSAEFKQDPRDEEYKIIEVNCRPWWYVEYAHRCGLNVCEYAYRDCLGLELPHSLGYTVGKYGTYPSQDLELDRISNPRSISGFFGMLYQWLISYQPAFCWSDPGPGIVGVFKQLRAAIVKRVTPRPVGAQP